MTTDIDPAHLADRVFRRAFEPQFGMKLSIHPHLGRELYHTIQRRIRAEGIHPADHTEEIFSRMMAQAFEYIHKHGSEKIREPRAWFHAIARNAASRYLGELIEGRSLEDILDGVVALPESHRISQEIDDTRLMELVREAIEGLTPRHREFILLDQDECLSEDAIKTRMNIRSHAYFRKLKCEAFKALRTGVRALIERTIASLF